MLGGTFNNGDKMFTEKKFLNQVQGHKLTVIKDDGLYRHLRVAIPGQYCESWNIHTWPGYLAMVGDMGNWVFQRVDDMLCFFRSESDALEINPSYWAEKLQAQEREGWSEFSIDAFHERVKEFAKDACDLDSFDELDEEKKDELWSLLNAEDEYEAVASVRSFDSKWLDLADFWDGRRVCEEVRDHFLFACYAIAWTVKLYDLHTPARSA